MAQLESELPPKQPSRPASAKEVLRVLEEKTIDLMEKLHIDESVQLSFPVDDEGVRIKVSVPPKGKFVEIPSSVEITLDEENVTIPLEVSDDYQSFEPFGFDENAWW